MNFYELDSEMREGEFMVSEVSPAYATYRGDDHHEEYEQSGHENRVTVRWKNSCLQRSGE